MTQLCYEIIGACTVNYSLFNPLSVINCQNLMPSDKVNTKLSAQ